MISSQTVNQIVDRIYQAEEGTRVIIYSPIVVGKKGMHEKTLDLVRKEGFSRVRIDGEVYDLDQDIKLEKNIKHTIEIIVDRVKLREDVRSRLYDSVETALQFGDGKVLVALDDKEQIFSQKLACPYCDFSIPKLEPRLFSFNSPFGACPECKGLGQLQRVDEKLLVLDPKLSIRQGAIRYLKNIVDTENIEWQVFEKLTSHYNIDLDKPYEELTPEEKEIIMVGSKEPITYQITTRGNFTYRKTQYIEGIASLIERRYVETNSRFSREYYNSFLADYPCQACNGQRLSREALSVYVGEKNIWELTEMSISEILAYLTNLELSEHERTIADLLLRQIIERLNFLVNVGLEYLTLSRPSATLSGGENQESD